MKNMLFVVVVAALAGCGESGKELTFRTRDSLPAADMQLAQQGIRTLINSCPGIARYWGDLEQQTAVDVKTASLTDEREYGWKRAVSVELKVSDSPEVIPTRYHATGHHCYFDVGISDPVGVSVAKRPCISICSDTDSKASPALIRPKL